MRDAEKLYHIYAKGRCIYHSLTEKEFSDTWEMMHKMIEILCVNIKKEDLQYEEVFVNKTIPYNSSY